MNEVEIRYAEVNGTRLRYVEMGAGTPCLVMHGGLGVDHTQFREWLDPLGDVLRLVYYDHRGNGGSGRPLLETLPLEQLVDDAEELRIELGFEQSGGLRALARMRLSA